ncbi:MAG: PVC-type heme-binding CxxCH protein [Anditalea sp.]
MFTNHLNFSQLFLFIISLLLFSCQGNEAVHTFNPKPNSRIVFIGNTFAEQLQQHNYFEALLYKSFPERNLTVRNLAWSADEVNLQPRPLNFGTLDEYLEEQKADIVFAFYGLNEAFKGPDSLENFKVELSTFLQHLKQQEYNGEKGPDLILVSPIAHEELGGFLPDPAGHNENLELYSKEMQQMAKEMDIPFLNLYESTQWLMEKGEQLTFNGIHPTDQGYKEIGEIMARALDFPISSWTGDDYSLDLRKVIHQKNKHFFYKYRTQNGEYVFGSRKEWEGGSTLPSELTNIDSMVYRLDTLVWTASQNTTGKIMGETQKIVQRVSKHEPEVRNPPSTDQFILQEGYEIELFASEIDFPIENPVTLTFDPQGRMWVASMPSYPQYYPGNPPNDKIVVLEDTDRDGKADKHTVFADSLYLPLGFELGDGGVYLTQAPDFVFLKDTDGDGKADFRKNLLHGFGTEDAHHAIGSYTWGPDGALYMHEGTFLHSQVETPYGPVRGAYGTTWRYEPRTMKLESYVSYPYANPWGNVFMRNGTHIIGDVSTGMNYFATPLTVASEYPKKHVEMRDFLTSKVKPKTCGHEIISSRHFPEEAQGNILFNTFVGFQGIKQHKLSKDGSGIIAEEIEPLLQSTDLNFRPVDLQFGPDGALYVVDWYNAIIQHGEQGFRESDRDHSHGRIWRITYKGNDLLKPLDLSALNVEELLDQLKTYEDRVRYRARVQLREFSEEEVLPVLDNWFSQLNPEDPDFEQHQLEGLWVYQQFHLPNEKALNIVLESKDEEVRAAATRVLFYWKDQITGVEDRLITMSKDPSQRVRVEAIAALSHFETETSVEALLATTDLPMDYYIDYALMESFKHLQPVWMNMFKKDSDFLADEPEKANFLLGPLTSPEQLALPGFLKGEPDWQKYARDPLSPADFEALADAPAIMKFWIAQKDIPDAARKKGVLLVAEKSGTLPIDVLLDAITSIAQEMEDRGLAGLSQLLVDQDPEHLEEREVQIKELAESTTNARVKEVCYALLADMNQDVAVVRDVTVQSPDSYQALVGSAKWLRTEKAKAALFPEIIKALNGNFSFGYTPQQRHDLKISAIAALPYMDGQTRETVPLLSGLITPQGNYSEHATKSLLGISEDQLKMVPLDPLKNNIIKVINSVPEQDRAQFLSKDLVKLGHKVAALLPNEERKGFLELVTNAETTVIEMGTLPGKMDFSIKNFTITAGQSVEIIFSNPDDMPHNMLILKPESLEKVGEMADNMAKAPDGYEKQFIPDTDLVLFSTPLINSNQTFSLKFVAPDQEGEFPYACTFPGHWRTMNGVMKVTSK